MKTTAVHGRYLSASIGSSVGAMGLVAACICDRDVSDLEFVLLPATIILILSAAYHWSLYYKGRTDR